MEQLLENYSPGTIVVFVVLLVMALANFVNQVGGALEKIAAARRAAAAPDEEQNRRLTELEEWRKEVDRDRKNNRQQLDEIHEGLRASYQAQLALLDHGIDGNNIKQMQDAKTVLQKHLIDHR